MLIAAVKKLTVGGAGAGAAAFSTTRNMHTGTQSSNAAAAAAPSGSNPDATAHHAPSAGGTARGSCSIPMEPVSKSLKTFEGVWPEYRHGSEAKPAIRQLMCDHGSAWQKAEYEYKKKCGT